MTVALDASAILAFVYAESGAERVAGFLNDGAISAVNAAEIAAKLTDNGVSGEDFDKVWQLVSSLVHDFDAAQALRAGQLRGLTRHAGLSLGDRSCLALAASLGARAVTCDRAWADLDIGIGIELVR